jgi:serine/threonine-protein kinase
VPVGTSDLASCAWLTLCEGSRIDGRFVLTRLIASGQDHAAYDALDEVVDRQVRVRLMPRPSLPDPRLRHPGVVTYRDRGCVGAWYASVLDPGEGTPLPDLLARLGPLPVDAVVAIATDLLEALEHVHVQGRVHGALSVESVHVGPAWQGRIVGFPEGFGPLTEAAMATAPPERWTGHRGDERSDVYAVGLLVHHMLTGRPAFGDGPAAREGQFLRSLPASEAIPPALVEVLRIATDKTPALRYPTAGSFAAALLGSIAAFRPAAGIQLDPAVVVHRAPVEEAWIATGTVGGETLDPAPRRVAAARPVVPVLLLVALCLFGVGLAGLAASAAVVVLALTSNVAAPPMSGSAAVPVVSVGAAIAPSRRVEAVAVPTAAGLVEVQVPVTFAYDSYAAERAPGFAGFVDRVQERRGTVRLTGHTDDRGSEAANHLMGLGRAWSTSLLLVAEGVREGRIELDSAGETQPIAPNDTPAGRARNRRVTAELEPRIGDLLR